MNRWDFKILGKNMRKTAIMMCVFWPLVVSFGQDYMSQLTPSQIEAIKKYQSPNKSSASPGADKYQTPDLYGQADSLKQPGQPPDSILNLKQAPIGQKPDSRISEEEPDTTLSLFGHDIFTADQQLFDPALTSLPPADYTLGPGDNLLVNVWGRVELEYNLIVDREGKVFIPKVGDIVALGCTIDKFRQDLDTRLGKIYSEYSLSVTMGKLRQIRIFVFGEVLKPGGYTTTSLATLLNAIYLAGGITDNGSLRKIQIIRNNKEYSNYDLYDLLLKGDNHGDLKLMSGDVVYVPVTGPRATITGEIRRPAIYELKADETITQLMALAGGASSTAYLQSISVDRVDKNDYRLLKDINIADSLSRIKNDLILCDGDKVTIPSIYDFHANTIYLTGHVKHPGALGLSDSMKIFQLLAGGDQLRENAYLGRADLYRHEPDGKKSVVAVSLDSILTGSGKYDFALRSQDSLVIYSNDKVNRQQYVAIQGDVKNPGHYNLYHNMKLSDLIFLAGDLTKSSYMLRAEIARTYQGKTTDLLYINLEDVIINKKPDADVTLNEDDHIFIRQIPEWRPIQMVTLDGEVLFPGKYAIKDKDEKLSDLIKRAGGLTQTAFPEGALYQRKTIARDVSRRNIGQIIKSTSETMLDSMGRPVKEVQINFDPVVLNRIIIDLPNILEKPGGPEDIVMADSDYVYVPARPSGIQIIGSVAANGTITYLSNKKMKYYIEQAGGYAPDADKSEIRLVKPSGKVYYGGQAAGHKITLGDAIVVPSRYKQKTDWSKTLSTTATIVGSLATTIFVVDRLR
jgi:protein involved in polysaccharide export with SLBB domain